MSHIYIYICMYVCSAQFSCSVVSDCLRPHEPQLARPPCPSPTPRVYTNSCPSNHFILCLSPSSIRVFSNESALCIRWPKYWSFSYNISPSNEHPGLISFRMDCLDLLAVQGTLKSLLQHHSSKASILQHSAFFIVQIWHPYMTTGKTIALTRQTLEKAMTTHSSTLAWKIPWTEELGGLQSMGSQRIRHDWTTSLSLFFFMHWRRKWQPIPIFLPRESKGWRSLVGCHLWGRTESDTTEMT